MSNVTRFRKGTGIKLKMLRLGKLELLVPTSRDETLRRGRWFACVTGKGWGNPNMFGHVLGYPFGVVIRNS
jgi:hypothetical protein